MQLSQVSESSFLQARMTMDSVRMECLAYQQLIEQQKEIAAKKIQELEEKLAQKEEIIRDHSGKENENVVEEQIG